MHGNIWIRKPCTPVVLSLEEGKELPWERGMELQGGAAGRWEQKARHPSVALAPLRRSRMVLLSMALFPCSASA